MNYLVTGTDTGVGKTFCCCGLIRAATKAGLKCIGMKPLCTGDTEDVHLIAEAAGNRVPLHLINQVWLRPPLAPYAAAMLEQRPIDLLAIKEAYQELSSRHEFVLVEGAGGLLVPILQNYNFRDLAADLNLKIVLVAGNRLGAINHTLLTAEAVKQAGLQLALVILNELGPAPNLAGQTNPSILEELLTAPLYTSPFGNSDFGAALKMLNPSFGQGT
ncbi:MAG: dethiobiotin synthase [Verrucomicrobia bacterium]|nr:dethiobiotin synthase [Verrucomicrobiota bacterium]MBV9274523.1 dethiobiotin synthase [Verrucomicrobiota bacterium]